MGINIYFECCWLIQASDYETRECFVLLLCKLLKQGKLGTNYLACLYLLAFETEHSLKRKGQEILRLYSKQGNNN